MRVVSMMVAIVIGAALVSSLQYLKRSASPAVVTADPGIPIHDIAMHLGQQTGGHVAIMFYADESDTSVVVVEQAPGVSYSSHHYIAAGSGHTLQEALQSLHSGGDDDE